MKVTQTKVRALRELQAIEASLKCINVIAHDWEDTGKEGITGFLLFSQLDAILEQVQSLNNKFE